MKDGRPLACQGCPSCRINRLRKWKTRLMLEATDYASEDISFFCLSYDDDHLPKQGDLATLDPKHLQDFLKLFRSRISPLKIRFYAVGEYGDETFRPHYHVIAYGYPTCRRGRTLRRGRSTRPVWQECCAQCRLVGEVWGKGDCDLGLFNDKSAAYCAGYTQKKMTRTDDVRLRGRWPEFARMSLRPGIGLNAMHDVADVWMKLGLQDREADVPSALRIGSKLYPLDSYLRRNLRKMVGMDENTPPEALALLDEKMRPVREAAFNNSQSFKEALIEKNKGAVQSRLARNAIFNRKRGKL